MLRGFLVLAGILLLAPSPALAQVTFGAVLTGAQEVPPNGSGGFGNATITLSADRTQVTVDLTVSNLSSAIIGAHIHGKALPGANAGIVLDLGTSTNLVNGRLSKTYTIAESLGNDLAANWAQHYLNVHTTTNPGGEIRGQLRAIAGPTKFAGELRGSLEVPATNSSAVGSFFLTLDSANTLTYEVNVGSLANITGSHIHPGAAGVNGGVLIGLTTASATFSNGRLKGTLPISATDAANIRANPSGFYVNVHTTAFPGGEIRGQLAPANEYDVAVAGRVVGASALFVTDMRIFNPSYTAAAAAHLEYFPANTTSTVAVSTMTVDIPARGTAILDDVNGTAFLNSPGTTGGVRVTSPSNLVVTSRIFADFRTTTGGTFGQFVPAVVFPNGLRRGVMPQLAHAVGVIPGFRTNGGFFNPNDETVDVRLELRNAAGTLLGSATVTLAPLAQQQRGLSDYFPGLPNQTNVTLSFDASGAILAYASVIDNSSSDQIFVPAQADLGVAASQ